MLVAAILSLLLVGGDAGLATTSGAQVTPAVQQAQQDTSTSPASSFNAPRCQGMADLSSPNRPVFIEKQNGEWECTYLLEYSETGHSPSVFIQIRGVAAGTWNSFRLKLNFGSLLSRQVLATRAASLVNSLFGTKTPLTDLDGMLASGREFELTFDGVTLKYRQERMDENRFNLFGSQNVVDARKTDPVPD